MSILEDLATQIRAVVELSRETRQDVGAATELIERAARVLGHALTGTTAAEADGMLAVLVQASDLLAHVVSLLDQAEAHMRRYLHDIGAGAIGSGTATDPASPSAAVATGAPASAQIERARASLPPPVVRGSGQKTHGRLIALDGTIHGLSSGRDNLAQRVDDELQGMGCPSIPITASADVELKAAVMMRDAGTSDPSMQDAILVINNRPCKGRLSCESLLPAILPTGYSLTVYAPNYRKRFTGGAKPWWR